MGSQRRKHEKLEELGVPEHQRDSVVEALEALESAGDSYSDVTYMWLSGEASFEETQRALAAVGTKLAAASAVVHQALPAPALAPADGPD